MCGKNKQNEQKNTEGNEKKTLFELDLKEKLMK